MTIISQQQNLRQFVATHLADVVDWTKHVRDDPERKTTGDQAFIVIATDHNRYKLSCASAYIDPPAGAPVTCRSLGTVTFYDPSEGKSIVGPKADQTWTDISRHIHVRELTDALAAGRRKLAEASAEAAGAARTSLAQLAARAAQWGVAAKIPQEAMQAACAAEAAPGPVTAISNTMPPDTLLAAPTMAPAPTVADIHGDPSKPAPFIGAPVVWITNPGEAIGGMTEIPGICVKVYSRERISIFVMPDHSEPSYRDNLVRRGTDAGNGRVHAHNCWDFNPHWLAEQEAITSLREDVAAAVRGARLHQDIIEDLRTELERLGERITALESAAKAQPAGAVNPAKPKAKGKAA